jgi:hypothetical protein
VRTIDPLPLRRGPGRAGEETSSAAIEATAGLRGETRGDRLGSRSTYRSDGDLNPVFKGKPAFTAPREILPPLGGVRAFEDAGGDCNRGKLEVEQASGRLLTTEIVSLRKFYRAEERHQRYLQKRAAAAAA